MNRFTRPAFERDGIRKAILLTLETRGTLKTSELMKVFSERSKIEMHLCTLQRTLSKMVKEGVVYSEINRIGSVRFRTYSLSKKVENDV
jgi:hypothetical protein